MESEDFEDIEDIKREILQRRVRESEKIFTDGCNEGYQFLKDHGKLCIDLAHSKDSARSALQRMLGYFIQIEQYEKCSIIKKVYRESFNDDPDPIFPNFRTDLDHE